MTSDRKKKRSECNPNHSRNLNSSRSQLLFWTGIADSDESRQKQEASCCQRQTFGEKRLQHKFVSIRLRPSQNVLRFR